MSKAKVWRKVISIAVSATVGTYLLLWTLKLIMSLASGTLDMQSVIDIPL